MPPSLYETVERNKTPTNYWYRPSPSTTSTGTDCRCFLLPALHLAIPDTDLPTRAKSRAVVINID
jgi:hypothetical protein